MMPKKGQYLERHGNQWRVTVKVTAKARPILGKAHLKRPLHTDSLPRAEAMKWSIIAELKAVVSEAERQADARARGGMDAIAAEALVWRAEIERGAEQPVSVDDEEHLINPALEVLDDRAEEIEKESGAEAARAFAEIAQGRATPIPSLLQSYFTEAELEPRTEADYRRAVERFAAWTQKQKLPGTIEQTTRKIAGRYISEALLAKAADGRTANKAVSALSSFWRWFITKAEQASIPKETIASVVGHERAGVTFGVYSGGPSWEQRTACVEAVKLEP